METAGFFSIEDMQEKSRMTASDAGAQVIGTPTALVELLEAVAGDREVANRLIGEFLDSYRERLDDMSAAISLGDVPELGKNAHQFRGCLGIFCRSEPLMLVQRLVGMAEDNTLAEAAPTLGLLGREMEKLETVLRDFIAR